MYNFIYEFFSKFTISDWLEFLGILTSLITGIIAICISVKTLKQNSHMIKESTRPYVIICGKTINCQSPNFYLMIKNHGTSGATITKFSCNYDLSNYTFSLNKTPFEHICGTFIAPGQSFITNLDIKKLIDEQITLHFEIEYKSQFDTYNENIDIDPQSYSDLLISRASTKNGELKIISYALQDLIEKHL